VPAAVQLGLKAQLAVKLSLDDQGTVGGLNMYSTSSDKFDPEAPAIADMFATHAALALGQAREIDHLHQALRTRELIGQAIGLLMAQYKLDPDAAFAFLVRSSSHANMKVRDIAEQMVEKHLAEIRREAPDSARA
jgi:GAF domain-containing protein